MTDKQPESKSSQSLRVIGWVLGALSVLNLIQDIGRMQIIGKLKVWLDAYALLVNTTGNFLFGWIHFGWVNISPQEHHLLVLSAVFCAAAFRAQLAHARQMQIKTSIALGGALGVSDTWFLSAFVPALLLPGLWGFFGAVWCFLFMFAVFFYKTNPTLTDGASIKEELVGVFGVFVVLVALNYSVFRTDGG